VKLPHRCPSSLLPAIVEMIVTIAANGEVPISTPAKRRSIPVPNSIIEHSMAIKGQLY
jgi:hypothetical protein